MDLDSYRIFVSLVKYRSFSKTAEVLHMSQSTVSQRMQNLESELGVALIVRSRHFGLTEAGEAILPHARDLIAKEREGLSAVQPFVAEVRGTVRVSASQTSGGYILPPVLCRFQDTHPEVEVQLRVVNSEDVIDAVESADADFGIVESPVAVKSVAQRDWIEDHLVMVVARDHPLGRKAPVDASALEGMMLAIREPGSGTRDTLVGAWPGPLDRSFRLIEVGSMAAVRQCVLSGRAAAFLSRWVVAEDLADGRLRALEVRGINAVRMMRIVKRREAFASKAASELYDAVSRAATDLRPPAPPEPKA